MGGFFRLNLVGKNPQDGEDDRHESDDLQEEPRSSTQYPIWKLETAGAIHQTDNHGQR